MYLFYPSNSSLVCVFSPSLLLHILPHSTPCCVGIFILKTSKESLLVWMCDLCLFNFILHFTNFLVVLLSSVLLSFLILYGKVIFVTYNLPTFLNSYLCGTYVETGKWYILCNNFSLLWRFSIQDDLFNNMVKFSIFTDSLHKTIILIPYYFGYKMHILHIFVQLIIEVHLKFGEEGLINATNQH
jgi:hypothetical protein